MANQITLESATEYTRDNLAKAGCDARLTGAPTISRHYGERVALVPFVLDGNEFCMIVWLEPNGAVYGEW